MSRSDPQVNFRMPADLKDRLEEAARNNRRSTTAEIVARLEDSFGREGIADAPARAYGDAAGTSFARPLAIGDAESLLDAARTAFRKEQIALLTEQLIAEIELTAVRSGDTEFDLTMTGSIADNIDKLAALKGTNSMEEFAAIMEIVERRIEQAAPPESSTKRIRRTREKSRANP
ncbi:hypothetical protein N619_01015 [Ectopseudomonas oleovorans]|nr:hypothetical protein N619_01015 [Pseudomonas oleovorans]